MIHFIGEYDAAVTVPQYNRRLQPTAYSVTTVR